MDFKIFFKETGSKLLQTYDVPKYRSILHLKKKLFKLSFYLTVPCFYILEFIDVAGLFWLGGGRRTPRQLELTSS